MALFGPNPEEEKIKRKAQQYQEQYAPDTVGQPDEPGIERSLDPGDLAMASRGAGLVKGAAGMAANQAKRAGIGRLLDSMPVASAVDRGSKSGLNAVRQAATNTAEETPRFDQAIEAGQAEPGASSFAKFIRGEAPEAADAAAAPVKSKLETVRTPRFGTSDRVKELQTERQTLDLKSPEGRSRLKDIDSILKNRTYFGG